METLAQRVKRALAHSGKNQTELANACGLAVPSVNNWISGQTKTLKYKSAQPASRFLGVRLEWLAEGKGLMLDDERRTDTPQIAQAPSPAPATLTTDQLIELLASRLAQESPALAQDAIAILQGEVSKVRRAVVIDPPQKKTAA